MNWKKFFNMIAFFAVTFIGVALLLAFIFKNNSLSGPLQIIAQIMAYIVLIFYALIYALSRPKKSKSQIIHLCIWAVASILIVIFVILNNV